MSSRLAQNEDRVFGELARQLRARTFARASGPILEAASCRDADALCVTFALAALSPDERALLAESPGLQLVERQSAPGCASLTGSTSALRELAPDRPALEALLAAHDNANRPLGPPAIMGILNVTPDSFSDGGRFLDAERAVRHGIALVEAGATILDVGGESTRPGADSVSDVEETDRVCPVLERLAEAVDVKLSVDTTKARVARAAIAAGATMINDVSAGRFDPELFGVAAEQRVDVVLMHMQNTPRDMQLAPRYDDVVTDVSEHLRNRVASCLKAGVVASRIAVDPGIGFGKSVSDNLQLIRALPELRSLGLPIVLGVSRKAFLGHLSGEEQADERGPETLAAVTLGCALGADIHRVHAVGEARAALAVAAAIRDAHSEDKR